VWAPKARELAVKVIGPDHRTVAMTRGPHDIFEARVQGLRSGTDYLYVIDGKKERPDPCSRFQPHGVHGPSRVTATDDFIWSDRGWAGVPQDQLVFYELHVGTFTEAGTFESIIPKLDYLAELGISAIELMPVAQFPGERNWGYDGVFPYAPQASYGGPTGLKRLIDESHRRGLAIAIDVVYNHLGPEGNYLGDFGHYFSDRYKTPWGAAINFDGPDSDEVRAYFRENALYWLTEFHIDALRFDAIHSIFDMGARHFLQETASAFHERAKTLGRQAYVIAESDLNDVRVIHPLHRNGFDFDAQWIDDFHHSIVAALTGTQHGYFAEYGTMSDVHKAIAEGFVFDGKHSAQRRRRHGTSSAGEHGHKFVVFFQNHDQIANAWHGRRITKITSLGRQRLAAATLFAHPGLPMLFMGQEFGELAPFDFFTSHSDPGLVDAVRRGRAKEFRGVGLKNPPDPQDESTFLSSKLDWSLLKKNDHRETLLFYRDLIALRRQHPALSNGRKDLTVVRSSETPRWITVERSDELGDRVMFLLNYEDRRELLPFEAQEGHWRLALDTHDGRYGGPRAGDRAVGALEVGRASTLSVECPGPGALIYVRSDPSP
jgi:maltooligosyltrehalose trehalohydrolase